MRRSWSRVRPLLGAAVLGVVAWRLGTAPFLDGVGKVDSLSLAVATAVTGVTTLCCAWRWRLVARGLGLPLGLGTAVLSYYGSQFANTTLPGGVLGDVHRGVHHGRTVHDTGRGLRAVLWERLAGQVVLVVIVLVVLLVLPSPFHAAMPVLLLVGAATFAIGSLSLRRVAVLGPSAVGRTVRAVRSDVRAGLLDARLWPSVVVTSAVAVVGHTVTFLVAARAVGVTASPLRMLPLALVVLSAMAVPVNIAGWGPREGAAAWVFGAAGLSAGQGVAASVAYGVMVLVASLPGAVVIAARSGWRAPAEMETSTGPQPRDGTWPEAEWTRRG
jgi:uncharacterized membrane protein YbhN (UPF0104 family)